MSTTQAKVLDNAARIVSILNEVLHVEYSMVYHFPRVMSRLRDENAKKVLDRLLRESMEHADTVAFAIGTLGGVPSYAIGPSPEGRDLMETLRLQLEKERLALQLYRQAAELVPPPSPLKDTFSSIAKAEESHVIAIESLLSGPTQ